MLQVVFLFINLIKVNAAANTLAKMAEELQTSMNKFKW
ncbi:methyl-accepting chemotaxis protein [Texcoconibacillus texcoconensis]|uniref:Methyl-accepting chemotaxis protein n=1 Tax=Texcoconibacillus texcoconensis TaxID=1095777 RepID=A0A840QMC0_9BACI|nr:methyl-accepting chemotaxis protein [Texcoconibacillus texcoconensis]